MIHADPMWKTPHGHHPIPTHLQHLLQLRQAMLQHRVTTQIQLQPALVGGFNPSEKYERQWEGLSQI